MEVVTGSRGTGVSCTGCCKKARPLPSADSWASRDPQSHGSPLNCLYGTVASVRPDELLPPAEKLPQACAAATAPQHAQRWVIHIMKHMSRLLTWSLDQRQSAPLPPPRSPCSF